MNLVKEYLATVAGVDLYAIISMLLFLITFFFIILHTYSLKKDDLKKFSRLPIEDEESTQE
jgi:hypothetical protein